MNLNYMILYVQDLAKEKAFYRDMLGLKVMEAVSSATFVTLSTDGESRIGLQDRATSRLPPRDDQPGSVELSFEVEDVDVTWKQWKEKGVEMITEPVDLPFGRYFLAKDPEGYYLSVYRFNKRS